MNTKWNLRELILLLLMALVFVPIFIEFWLHRFLLQAFENTLYAGTMTGFIMSIIFTLSVYLIALKPHQLGWEEVGLRSFRKSYWKWIPVWTGVLIVSSILLLIVMDIFGIGVDNSKTESLKEQITWFTFTIAFLSAAGVSPIYEEIFYRGFLYKWLRGRWGVWAGLIGSSLIFTVVHIPTYNTLPVNFISGMIFAWTYEKSGSVIPAMIIHGVFNGLAVMLTVVG
ncbi:CPBP family intramembrane glutamic endopeptidase [Sutcliffiella horikoshii]|uniref:CPBP family intramembrane glutamic endopeptidase n=1 Tax=Sutcliffiella horikoshii TaxID=79883 RepID=UPI001F1BF488|nr:type II CAAX endopeptidase family protein [Sutcliffiella horikoshii]MCG1023498.1 CPBP family intramembrane metalloprotease [Sutcliffiella horikoshii]